MRDKDRPTALVTAPLRGEGLVRLRELAGVVYDPWIDGMTLRIYSSSELVERAVREGADVLVVEADVVAAEVFALPLRAVAATRADPVNVDLDAATAAGVPVLCCPGRNADAVAELALALILALNRKIYEADAEVRSGQVFRDGTIPYQRFRSWELRGRTAGLVGLGAVGRALRWRLEALGMTVVAHDPYADEAKLTLDDLLDQSDVVSLHAPVTPSNAGMIGEEQFAAMRPGSLFVNTARAQLHDTDALVEALRCGHLGGAALDHFVGEQLPEGHPLTSLPNVLLTPHIGGATWDTECRQASMVADDLTRLLSGERPLHLANPGVYR